MPASISSASSCSSKGKNGGAPPATTHERQHKIGLLGAVSYIIGNIVGSGIFITPTSILKQTKSKGLALTVWLASALISVLASFCYVELGTSIRISGADFAYLCYVRWFPIAFSFMCVGCIVTYPATLAVQALTFSEYVFKGFSIEDRLTSSEAFWAKKLLGFALMWVLLFLNFFSLKFFVQKFQILASLAKFLAAILIIVMGAYHLFVKGETHNLQNMYHGSSWNPGDLVVALFAGLFSYDGWDILNFGAEEIENPKRTMSLAIIIGMTTIAFIYLAMNVSYFVVLSYDDIVGSDAVAQTFGDQVLGHFKYVIPFCVAILLIGSMNSTIFSASRYLFAAAKQGHLPSFIAGMNPDHESPRIAVLIHVLLSMGIAFAGDLDKLINYVAFAQWSQRAFTMCGLLWIRYSHKAVHPDAIRMPIIMPIVFFFVCAALVIDTIAQNFSDAVVGLGILLGGLIAFILFIWDRMLPSTEFWKTKATKADHNTTVLAQIIFNVMPIVSGEEGMTMDMGTNETVNDNKVHPTSNGNAARRRTASAMSSAMQRF